MLQFEIFSALKNAQKIRENVAVDKKSAYVIYEWPHSIGGYGTRT